MKRRDFLKIVAASPFSQVLIGQTPSKYGINPKAQRAVDKANEQFDNLIAPSGYVRHHDFWFYANEHNSFVTWCNINSRWLCYGNRDKTYPQPDASWWMVNVCLDSFDRDVFERWEKYEDKLFWCGRYQTWQLEPESNARLAEENGDMRFKLIRTERKYWGYD